MINTVNEKICPFCKGQNKCLAHTDASCWCNDVEVPISLTDLVPSELKRKTCICLSCIEAYNDNPNIFIKRYSAF